MVYLVSVTSYLLLLIGISVFFGFRVKTQEDFMVAGRRLTWPILVGTLLATWIGSGSIFGGGTLGFEQGFAALWQPAGAWVGLLLIYFIAGRARRFGQFTVPDLMEERYNVAARVLATIATILSYAIIVSYQFRGGGIVLNLVLPDVTELEGILITAVFATLFTAFAGLLSVAYTDIANGAIIVTSLVVAVPALARSAGGWAQVRAGLDASHFSLMGTMSLQEALGFFLPTMFLLLGNANMYQRFFAARDERHARLSVAGWVVGLLVVETLVIALAVIGSSMPRFAGLENHAHIIPTVARHGLPVAVGCLLLSAIAAIIVSTADSFLLVPATNLVRDIYQRFVNPEASQSRIVWYSRGAVILLGLVSFGMTQVHERILDAVVAAYTIYGASITPALLAIFLWRRATPAGGVASILAGTAIGVGWEVWRFVGLGGEGFPLDIETIYSSLLASILALIGVSLLTRPREAGAADATLAGGG
ncbi:MAG: sodium:solute symporter [Acidobacteriota bacterium]